MGLSRRRTLVLMAGAVILPAPLHGREATGETLLSAMTGGGAAPETDLAIDVPAAPPDGASVAITLSCRDAELIRLFAPANPFPEVFTARFGARARREITTRIRLDGPQTLIAVARLHDGSYRSARAPVDVGTSGCF